MSDVKHQNDVCETPSPKKLKIVEKNDNGVSEINKKLKDFTPEKILSNNTNRKTVCVQGHFKDKSGAALIILNKNAFTEDEVIAKGYFSADTKWSVHVENDIYSNLECYPPATINSVSGTLIFPATEKHIAKYSQQKAHIVLETPELYEKCTLPHLQEEQFNLQWVYNILEGKSEQDRVIYDSGSEQDGFVLLPDLKWDGVTRETLYLLAIVRPRGLKSLRDLDASSLPLLRKIRDEGKKAVLDKYGVEGSQLRLYLHYQPTFYHLHVHVTYLQHEAPGIHVEKSHLLDTVINNIEMMSDYYKKATLPFTIREMDKLFNVYEVNGCVARVKPNIDLNSDPIVK